MKIVFLSRYQDQLNRGAERVVSELASHLKNEFEVIILSGEKADDWRSVKKLSPDLVIPVNGRWQALKMSWGRLIGGYQVLITGHSGLGRDDFWNLVVARPNVFVGLTKVTLSNYRMRVGRILAFGVKVVRIPNGVDLRRFKPTGPKLKVDLPKPLILSVGALVDSKRHHLVIEAVSRLAEGSLLIVGDGPLKEKLARMGHDRLGGRFRLISADSNEMPGVYRAADLFTLPSWEREAFGLVYLEALATNLPVVAPDDQSRREIIGDAGLYCQVDQAKEYALALKSALEYKWGDRPRQRAEQFSWEKVAAQYRDCILKLCR